MRVASLTDSRIDYVATLKGKFVEKILKNQSLSTNPHADGKSVTAEEECSANNGGRRGLVFKRATKKQLRKKAGIDLKRCYYHTLQAEFFTVAAECVLVHRLCSSVDAQATPGCKQSSQILGLGSFFTIKRLFLMFKGIFRCKFNPWSKSP